MKSFFFLLLGISICCASCSRNDVVVNQADIDLARVAFAEFSETVKKDDGELWNHSLDGGILLINSETRVVIANEPDQHGALKKRGDVYVGRLPEKMLASNTAIEWNGKRWATYTLPLPEKKEDRVDILVHESFHRIQPSIGFSELKEEPSVHLDTKEGRVLLKLELEALKEALKSDEPIKHLKNALTFRLYRHQQFPEAKVAENSLEINEGIAQYTGSILAPRSSEELKQYYVSMIDRFYEIPTFVRSFAYFTIPVYGYIMKQSVDKWNQKINGQTNLTDFIVDFYQIEPSIISRVFFQGIGDQYNIQSIQLVEDKRELKRLEQEKMYRIALLGDSAFEISLQSMNISFNPQNLVPLNPHGIVYPNMMLTDVWGTLSVDSLGALISPSWNKVTISQPVDITDTLVLGKGWSLRLNSSWTIVNEEGKFKLVEKK